MAFKISSNIIINDSSQFGEGANVTNLSGVDSGGFSSTASGHTKNFGWGTSLVELTAPDVDYSTGVSNILNFDSATAPQGANPHRFVLKLTGNENRGGFGNNSATQVGSVQPFGASTRMQAMDVSRDGLHWYFYDDTDGKIKHYTPSTAWAYNSLGSVDDEFTLGLGDDSSGRSNGETIRISEDGEYMLRGTVINIYRYDLSTPWDISSATLAEKTRWPVQDSDDNSMFRWDIKRDGTKIIQSHTKTSFEVGGPGAAFSNRTRLWTLQTPWSIDSSSMVLDKKVRYGISGSADLRISPDNTRAISSNLGVFTTNINKTQWLTPWELDSDYTNTFSDVNKGGSGGDGTRIILSSAIQYVSEFVVRPGGSYLYGLDWNNGAADVLYLFNIQDSTGNQVPQTFSFPANVHFEDGYIDFPGTGETSYVEFISIDSGDNWYAKELYKG